jgi:diacylglycerol kinase family enzyme
MYYYIFDPPTGPNDYQRAAQIKEKLTALGIAGEMASPMPGKSVADLVKNAIAKRYATIVAVGDMPLINQVAQALEPYDAVLGIIPLHEQPDLAELIGAPTWETATEQLKRRRWQPIRLGLIQHGGCFLTPATIEVPPKQWVELRTPQFTARTHGGTIRILSSRNEEFGPLIVDILFPEKQRTGLLSSLFGSNKKPVEQQSHFLTSSLEIITETPLPVVIAGSTMAQTPLVFTTQQKPLRLIVAKGTTQA